jgi:hypothetical protein
VRTRTAISDLGNLRLFLLDDKLVQQNKYLSHAASSLPIISLCFAWIPIGAGLRKSGIPASAGVRSAFRLLHG